MRLYEILPMPLYEYHCPDCESRFEALIRFDDRANCPKCGSAKPDRLLSAPATHVSAGRSLPMSSACPPSDAPPCNPHCCRLP